jgi:lipoprotein-releasing system permease protein
VFLSYLKYFFHYIVTAKNRQRLLILAVVGLVLSSFALIILQSTMGGLQNKLMERSKKVLGRATIRLSSDDDPESIIAFLNQNQVVFLKEFEMELLLRFQTYITPVVVHGIDLSGRLPAFLAKEKISEAIIPMELAYKIGAVPPETMQLVSPSHVDSLFTDIPRTQSMNVEKTFTTDVPEIDANHLWVRLPLIQNLVRSKTYNRIRIYSDINVKKLRTFLSGKMILKTWEEENATLVWALNLESSVMIFLFAAMSLLVSLCISSGLMIFFNKIKTDLSSFWILGASLFKINQSTKYFLHLMSFLSILGGLALGLLFLFLFDKMAADIMPNVFVDRRIPILITQKGLLISFFVPYCISWLFITFSLRQFKKEYNLLDHVRSMS